MRVVVARRLCIFAAVFLSNAAWADRVVILEFEGDRAGKLRAQVEAATKRTQVRLVPLKKFKEAAAAKKLKGRRAMSPVAVARLAPVLKYDVAIEGAVGDSFFVRILDTNGQEIWSKELPITRGKQLSALNAKRLASAIKVAAAGPAKIEAPKAPAPSPSPPAETPAAVAPVPEKPPEAPAEKPPEAPKATASLPPPAPKKHARVTPQVKVREPDIEPKHETPSAKRVGPPLFKARLAGTTTWRSYCARPGVKSCGDYNSLPEAQRPPGDIADFSPQVPYLGFEISAEVFPLKPYTDGFWQGLGIGGAFQMGFSSTSVRVVTPTGTLPDRKVIGVDLPWSVMAIYRHYFSRESEEPLLGYLGLNAGFGSHNFDLDNKAQTRLPGSHRRYPFAGIEASYPVVSFLSVEATAYYLIAATAGPDEIAGYGATASSGFAWQAELGVAGHFWGPLGYSARGRMSSFTDKFVGQGTLWTNGGAAQETYISVVWGITAQF